jgi:integrase
MDGRRHGRRPARIPHEPKPAHARARARCPLVLGNLDGTHRHPERYSRRFVDQIVQARRTLGEDQLPKIRLHDLRHAHGTLLLTAASR